MSQSFWQKLRYLIQLYSFQIELFKQYISKINDAEKRPYQISASIGNACVPLNSGMQVSGIIRIADAKMYENKVHKKSRDPVDCKYNNGRHLFILPAISAYKSAFRALSVLIIKILEKCSLFVQHSIYTCDSKKCPRHIRILAVFI